MSDHRINGQGFTCRNRKFETDLDRGHAHGAVPARGSVFAHPLLRVNDGDSLWLEHVRGRGPEEGSQGYWLMWYGADGNSKTPATAFFQEAQLGELVERLLRASQGVVQ